MVFWFIGPNSIVTLFVCVWLPTMPYRRHRVYFIRPEAFVSQRRQNPCPWKLLSSARCTRAYLQDKRVLTLPAFLPVPYVLSSLSHKQGLFKVALMWASELLSALSFMCHPSVVSCRPRHNNNATWQSYSRKHTESELHQWLVGEIRKHGHLHLWE